MLLFLLLVVLLMILPFKEATNPCAVATWRFGSIAVEKCKQMLIGYIRATFDVQMNMNSNMSTCWLAGFRPDSKRTKGTSCRSLHTLTKTYGPSWESANNH